MTKTIIIAGLFAAALATPAFAQSAAPLSVETQSGSNTSAKAVTPSASASTSAATQMGATENHDANIAAANAADPARAVQNPGIAGNTVASASGTATGSVTPNGSMTSSPQGAGASSEATLNEHGATGTANAAVAK